MITVLVVFSCLSARNTIWMFLWFNANVSQIDLHNLQALLFYYAIFRSWMYGTAGKLTLTLEKVNELF